MDLVENNQKIQRRIYLMFATLVLLNIGDVVYTYRALELGATETNFLMATLYQYNGIWGIALFKGAFLLLLLPLLTFLPFYNFLRKAFYSVVAVYGALFSYHLFWYFIWI